MNDKGELAVGTIICQGCNCTIDHFEDEKVTTLYGRCQGCEEGIKIPE